MKRISLFLTVITLLSVSVGRAESELDPILGPTTDGVYVHVNNETGKATAYKISEKIVAELKNSTDEKSLANAKAAIEKDGTIIGTFKLDSANTNDLDEESNTSACRHRGRPCGRPVWHHAGCRRGWHYSYNHHRPCHWNRNWYWHRRCAAPVTIYNLNNRYRYNYAYPMSFYFEGPLVDYSYSINAISGTDDGYSAFYY